MSEQTAPTTASRAQPQINAIFAAADKPAMLMASAKARAFIRALYDDGLIDEVEHADWDQDIAYAQTEWLASALVDSASASTSMAPLAFFEILSCQCSRGI